MKKLAIKDMKIIQELDFAARQPISRIAKRIGLSPEVTTYRIKQLEKKGIITGYYPVIDLSKLGYMFCRFRFFFNNLDDEVEKEFILFCRSLPSVGWVLIGSNSQVGIICYARNVEEARLVFNEVSEKFSYLITSKAFSIADRIWHLRRNYLYNEEHSGYLLWGGSKQLEIDQMDKRILHGLIANARISYVDLAKEVNLSSVAILKRIKKMEQNRLILGYRPALNLPKLGYTHYKIFLFTEKMKQERLTELREVLILHPNVVYITQALGPADLEFEMHASSEHNLMEFLRDLQKKFAEIKSVESKTFYKEIIIRYFPADNDESSQS